MLGFLIGGIINLITKVPEQVSPLSIESFSSSWGEINTDLGEESAQLARDAAGNSGGDAVFIETDVTSHESVKNAVSEALERFGKLDICLLYTSPSPRDS